MKVISQACISFLISFLNAAQRVSHMLLKIPFDQGNLKQQGAALAPHVLAKAIHKETIDVQVNSGNFEETQENIEKVATKYFEKGKVASIGGDHSITYGLVKAASKKFKNLGLVYFDAHLDCEDDFLPPSHEDVVRAIVKEKLVAPENILMIGVRKTWPKEEEFVRKHNIRVVKPGNSDEALRALKELNAKCEHLYVSVDIDVFDPEIAPATVYREKNGLNFEDFKKFITVLNFKRIIGFDLVEYSPSLDSNGKTGTLASNVIKFLLV